MTTKITMFDLLKCHAGKRAAQRGARADAGTCYRCEVGMTVAMAHPTWYGYPACAQCVGDDGFDSIEQYNAWERNQFEHPEEN